MMSFKSNVKGFLLLEALLSVLLVSMIMMPLFTLQSTIMEQIGVRSRRFGRLLAVKQFLYESRRQQPEGATSFSVERGGMKYILRPLTAKNNTLKEISSLCHESATVQWGSGRRRRMEQATYLLFKPEKPSE